LQLPFAFLSALLLYKNCCNPVEPILLMKMSALPQLELLRPLELPLGPLQVLQLRRLLWQ
jgi:hypothetical protein